MLVAPGEGAIMAGPEGATAPRAGGSEWGTKRAAENFLNIFLDSDAALRESWKHLRRIAKQQDCSAVAVGQPDAPQMSLATNFQSGFSLRNTGGLERAGRFLTRSSCVAAAGQLDEDGGP